MLVVETIARIRRDHLVKGVPIKKIARDLMVSKNCVNGGAKRDHLGGVRRDRLAAAGLSP